MEVNKKKVESTLHGNSNNKNELTLKETLEL